MVTEVKDLAVQLEEGLELSNIEQGIKLIATVLADQQLNKWGLKNILKSDWKEYRDIQINWVNDNSYIFVVRDESIATQILDQVSWAVMKQNLYVKR